MGRIRRHGLARGSVSLKWTVRFQTHAFVPSVLTALPATMPSGAVMATDTLGLYVQLNAFLSKGLGHGVLPQQQKVVKAPIMSRRCAGHFMLLEHFQWTGHTGVLSPCIPGILGRWQIWGRVSGEQSISRTSTVLSQYVSEVQPNITLLWDIIPHHQPRVLGSVLL